MKRALVQRCPGDHAVVREQYVAAFRIALAQAEATLTPEQAAQWAVLRPAIERYWRQHPQDGTDRDWLAAATAILGAFVRGRPLAHVCRDAVGRDWEALCERVALAEPAAPPVLATPVPAAVPAEAGPA